MKLEDVHVEVRGRGLNGSGTLLTRQGVILPRHLVLKAKTRWCDVGEWELTLPGGHPMVPYLEQDGSGLIVRGPDGPSTSDVLFSGPTTLTNRTRGVENPDGTLTFKGLTDEIHLADAVAFPSPAVSNPSAQTQTNDTRSGKTETLLRAYVRDNLVTSPVARRTGYRGFITVPGSDGLRGVTLAKSPRFQNLLELLQEIASTSLLGFRVVQVGNQLQYQIVETRDLRRVIRLDVEAGTLGSEETEETGPALTRPIVAGQDSGTARKIITVADSVAAAAEVARGRVIEQFFDRRDTNDDLELQTKAREELAAAAGGVAAKAMPMDTGKMRYGYDWREGDWITVLVNRRELAAVVTEAVYQFTPETSGVAAALGDVSKFTADALDRKKQAALDSRLSYIERAG